MTATIITCLAFVGFISWLNSMTTKALTAERNFYKNKCIDLMAGKNSPNRSMIERKLHREMIGIPSIRAGDTVKSK